MPIARTPLEISLLVSLKRIASYMNPEALRRSSHKLYGVEGDEAIEMAYENVLYTARLAVKGVRVGKSAPPAAPNVLPEIANS